MAETHHIERIDDTLAILGAPGNKLDNLQIAIATDNNAQGFRPLVYRDGAANFRQVAILGDTASFTDIDITTDLTIKTGATLTHDDFTLGSVVIVGASGLITQDNAGLFFDAATNRLSINTLNTVKILNLNGDIQFTNDSLTRTIDTEAVTSGNGVAINVTAGQTTDAGGTAGSITIKGGTSTAAEGPGEVIIQGGVGASTVGNVKIGNGSANTSNVFLEGNIVHLRAGAGGRIEANSNDIDVDFIVNGDTNPNLIYVDASTDLIGFGTSAPKGIHHIARTTGADTDSGINYNVGNIVASSGTFTQSAVPARFVSDSGTLTDDGSLIIVDSQANVELGGFGFVISTNNESGFFRFDNSGITLISNTANVVTTDTDTKLALLHHVSSGDSTTVTVKNRLGATTTITYFLWYGDG